MLRVRGEREREFINILIEVVFESCENIPDNTTFLCSMTIYTGDFYYIWNHDNKLFSKIRTHNKNEVWWVNKFLLIKLYESCI